MILHLHKCPCCGSSLCCNDDGAGRFVVHCGNGRCVSAIGDRGALGDTPEQAADKLNDTMLNARDWED